VAAIKLDKYGGMLPAWDVRLLPEGQAAFSRDAYIFSGNLTGWRQPKLLRTLRNSAAKYVYRVPDKTSNNTAITAPDSHWLEFLDPDTTVMHTPIVDDQYDRFYFASPSQEPRYNTYDRIVAGDHDWVLGVPASGCPPGVTVTGGGDTTAIGYQFVDAVNGGGATYQNGNGIFLVPIVPSGAMMIQSISFMPGTTDAAMHYQAVVYSDNNGAPYQLLGTGEDMVGVTTSVEANSAIINSVNVMSNVTYWIGIAHSRPMYVFNANNAVTFGTTGTNTYSNSPPDPISGTTGGQPVTQVWGNLLGASVFEARGYVYTWVTEYGEEGPPSPPVVVNGWSNATWTIDLFQPTIENLGADYPDPNNPGEMLPAQRNIKTTKIYRTISNQAGLGSYFFVAEVPVSQGQYVDTISDDVVALNAQMVSLYWYGPPPDMKAIKAFPNGVAVGYKGNEVWFSEAYRPHAWPPGYVITTEFPIMGIGVCGQSIVVCTQGTPYVVNGVNPASMAMTKINLPEPCLHGASIVPTDTAVLYVSQNGLIQISQSGAGINLTEGWILREQWKKLTPQATVRAVKLMTNYFAFGAMNVGDPMQVGYTVELTAEDQTSFTIWPQAGGHRLGFNTLSSPNKLDIDNVELDAWTGICLLVQGGGVYFYDFTDADPIIIPYLWRSKTFQQEARRNFEVMRVFFSVPSTTPPQVDRDITFPQSVLGPNQYGIVRVYVDGQLWCTREIRTSGELLRIFSGIKAEQWSWELEGRVEISNVQTATSVKELALV